DLFDRPWDAVTQPRPQRRRQPPTETLNNAEFVRSHDCHARQQVKQHGRGQPVFRDLRSMMTEPAPNNVKADCRQMIFGKMPRAMASFADELSIPLQPLALFDLTVSQ